MSANLRNLEPKELWNFFADLNAVPRPSKKEERVRAFMVAFGEGLGLPTHVDQIGNVIITKPASKGMENRHKVVLQSHLDMVHQKNADTAFDFDTEGIRMRVDGDWLKAEGTTLGADNGIGVATIMALLASNNIPHPALEALFTIDEETGMTGAQGLKPGELTGKYLLNLDTEDDDVLSIGCAGGVDVSYRGTYTPTEVPTAWKAYQISVKGLNGGHSGMDIHKGLANANKLLTRTLWKTHAKFGLHISELSGGSLRNAIPREATALVAIPAEHAHMFVDHLNDCKATFKKEYSTTDPKLDMVLDEATLPQKMMDQATQQQLLAALCACPNGIYRLSPDIPDLVQTSNNLARVSVENGNIEVLCLTRSSVDSEKIDQAQAIEATFAGMNGTVEFSGSYPGWTPKPDSSIVHLMTDLYRELFTEEPRVAACHAGLECGLLGTHYRDMEMISFGPNIRGAHSPDEKVQISSVQKFWNYTLEALKRIPEA
jgi:dipeptidase D